MRIHFFPGSAPCGLIEKQLLSKTVIGKAFETLKEKNESETAAYTAFKDIIVYSDNEQKFEYKEGDIIVAGSVGGRRANEYIKKSGIKDPVIVAFEAAGLEEYKGVYHFVSQQGAKKYLHEQHTKLLWDDSVIGHNSYMLHFEKDKIVEKSSQGIQIKAKDESEAKGHFILFDQVTIKRNNVNQKLSNVLLLCNSENEVLNPNTPDQSSILIDLIVRAAYACATKDFGHLPVGFSVNGPKNSKENESSLLSQNKKVTMIMSGAVSQPPTQPDAPGQQAGFN